MAKNVSIEKSSAQLTLEKVILNEKMKLAGALQERDKQGTELNKLAEEIAKRQEELNQYRQAHQNVTLTIDRLNQVVHTLSGTLADCGVDLTQPLFPSQPEPEKTEPVEEEPLPEQAVAEPDPTK